MPKFKRKPVTIDAEQFFPELHVPPVLEVHPEDGHPGVFYYLHTPSGPLGIRPGDWIVTFPTGETRIMGPTEFSANYEAARG